MTNAPTPTLLERMGGVSGLVYASVPTFAYVIANAIALLVVYWAVRHANRRGVVNDEANERMVSQPVEARR